MKDFKEIRKNAIRQQFRHGGVFNEGDVVMSSITGEKGKIYRTGVNYVIAITEEGQMFRAWINDIRLVNVVENINKEKESIFFTNGKTKPNDISSSS